MALALYSLEKPRSPLSIGGMSVLAQRAVGYKICTPIDVEGITVNIIEGSLFILRAQQE